MRKMKFKSGKLAKMYLELGWDKDHWFLQYALKSHSFESISHPYPDHSSKGDSESQILSIIHLWPPTIWFQHTEIKIMVMAIRNDTYVMDNQNYIHNVPQAEVPPVLWKDLLARMVSLEIQEAE